MNDGLVNHWLIRLGKDQWDRFSPLVTMIVLVFVDFVFFGWSLIFPTENKKRKERYTHIRNGWRPNTSLIHWKQILHYTGEYFSSMSLYTRGNDVPADRNICRRETREEKRKISSSSIRARTRDKLERDCERTKKVSISDVLMTLIFINRTDSKATIV